MLNHGLQIERANILGQSCLSQNLLTYDDRSRRTTTCMDTHPYTCLLQGDSVGTGLRAGLHQSFTYRHSMLLATDKFT